MKRSTKSRPGSPPPRTSSARNRFCPTATPAPWDCSTAPAWTAASSIASAHRGSIAPSARPRAWPGMTDALGVRYALEPEQFRHAKLIIAWGANILGTNVHLWPFIVEARRNGAQILHNRPASEPHREAFRSPLRDPPRDRRRARAGDDARHPGRRSRRPRLRGAAHARHRRTDGHESATGRRSAPPNSPAFPRKTSPGWRANTPPRNRPRSA